MTAPDDPSVVAGDVFSVLLGEQPALTELDECRSRTGTPTIDVRLRGRWYRLTVASITEPITEREHNADIPTKEPAADAYPT